MIATWKMYVLLFVAGLLFVGGISVGYLIFHRTEPNTTITSQTILTALHNQGFLVTLTYILNEPIVIKKSSGSELKDFFFGETITAQGAMEVNMGISLASLSPEDISVEGDTVVVMLPNATLFNVRPVGPLAVKNERGILKRLLESDTGYNEALSELTRIAEETATQPAFLERANVRAQEEVGRILGYGAPGKKIEIRLKSSR